MFVVKKTSIPTYSIIFISSIQQSCILTPKFDPEDNWHSQGWKKENVLDLALIFYLIAVCNYVGETAFLGPN